MKNFVKTRRVAAGILLLFLVFILFPKMAKADSYANKIDSITVSDAVMYNGDQIKFTVKAQTNPEEVKKIILTYQRIGGKDAFSVSCDYNSEKKAYIGTLNVAEDIGAGDYNLQGVHAGSEEGAWIQASVYSSPTLSKIQLSHVDSIRIKENDFTMNKGEKRTLTAELQPSSQILQAVMWDSQKPSVASVDSYGKVTAKKAGKTTITASIRSDDGSVKSASITVTVDYAALKSASAVKKSLVIKQGQKKKAELKLNPVNSDIRDIKWTSSSKKIASVSKDGYISGNKIGKTTVTGVITPYKGKKCTVKIKVEIINPLIIVLDPGHGDHDPGAMAHGLKERDINLQIAKACQAELKKYKGVEVYLTRTSNSQYLSLSGRAAFAKKVGADMLISIHINSGSKTAKGSEVYVTRNTSAYKYNKQMKALAQDVLTELQKLGLRSRGIKTRKLSSSSKDYYGVIRCSVDNGIPAMIIEHCFISSSDYKFINSASKTKKLGVADAKAIVKFFGLEKK